MGPLNLHAAQSAKVTLSAVISELWVYRAISMTLSLWLLLWSFLKRSQTWRVILGIADSIRCVWHQLVSLVFGWQASTSADTTWSVSDIRPILSHIWTEPNQCSCMWRTGAVEQCYMKLNLAIVALPRSIMNVQTWWAIIPPFVIDIMLYWLKSGHLGKGGYQALAGPRQPCRPKWSDALFEGRL